MSSSTRSNTPFAERLRAAKQREESSRRTSFLSWFRGPRAGFSPGVAVEPHDTVRPRDEYASGIRDAS